MNAAPDRVDSFLTEPYPPDLPAWMHPRRRRIDWGLLIVSVVGLLLIWPLAAWPGLPRESDAALFVARSEQVVEALRSGTLYPRWAADFNFGFGSPLFNYLTPLPHMLTGWHELITDADPVNSVKLALALSVLTAGIGMYFLAGRRYGAVGGVIGALGYLCSMPIAYALPIQTGDLAALLSLALLPWALWAVDRLTAHPGRVTFLGAVIALAAWSLADTRLTLLAIPLFGIISLSGLTNTPHRRESLTALLWAFGIAALLTAFFWLPALAERSEVVWLPLAIDPRSSPISLGDSLFVLPAVVSGVLNPPPALGLGPGVTLSAAIGGLLVITEMVRSRRLRHWEALIFSLLAIGAALLATPGIAHWWQQPNGWQPIRPYDLLIGIVLPGAALVASCSGMIFAPAPIPPTGDAIPRFWPENKWLRRGLLAALSAIPLLTILPSLSMPAWTPDPAMSASPTAVESATHTIASLRYGLLLPIIAYQPSTPLSKIAFAASEANPVPLTPSRILVSVDLPSPFLSRFSVHPALGGDNVSFDRLAFPGWWLTVDDQPRTPSVDSAGRIALDVPSSAHAIVIGFGTTPIRTFGWLLTSFGVVVLIGRAFSLRRAPDASELPMNWARGDILTLGVVLVAFALMSSIIRLSPDTPSPTSNTSIARYPTYAALVDAPTQPIHARPGEVLPFTFIWQAEKAVTHDYQLTVRLIPDGTPQSPPDSPQWSEWQPGGIPTSQWPPNVLVQDRLTLTVPPNAAPGMRYLLQVQLAECSTPTHLPCSAPIPIRANQTSEDWLTLPGSVVVDVGS